MTNRIVALIPAHLASVRFPRKVLEPIRGLPMIEHVRRRAAMVAGLATVAVATADEEIAEAVTALGGHVLRTSGEHVNGTERVAQAAQTLDATHVLLIQGDEPLLLPQHVEAMVNAITLDHAGAAWNATGPILTSDDLERRSVVKAMVGADSRILACSRRNPSVHGVEGQDYVRKVLGLIAYSAETLREIVALPPSVVERHELIEQMRLIENGYLLRSVPVDQSTPSVNEPEDLLEVLAVLEQSEEQQELLEAVLASPGS